MILKFSKSDYPKEVIEKAILSFESQYALVLEIVNGNFIVTSKNNKMDKELFLKELLYNDLRYQISQRTNTIKKLIIGRALYDTCIRLDQS